MWIKVVNMIQVFITLDGTDKLNVSSLTRWHEYKICKLQEEPDIGKNIPLLSPAKLNRLPVNTAN